MHRRGAARHLVVAVLVLSCAGKLCEGETEKPATGGQAAFVAELIEAMRAQRPGDSFVLDSDGTTVKWTHGPELKGAFTAGNFYDEYKKGQTPAEIAKKVLSLVTVKHDQTNAVLPAVRQRSAIESTLLKARELGKSAEIPFMPVGRHFVVALFEDRPDTMLLLTSDQYAQRDAGFDALKGPAVEALLERPAPQATEVKKGCWRFEGDEYASTQVLLGRAIAGLKLAGRAVVILLNRESAVVAGKDDAAAMTCLAAVATKHADEMSGRDFQPVALVQDGDGWTELTGAGEALERLRLSAWAVEYSDQKRELDLDLADAGDDAPFVASVKLMRSNEDGRILSLSVLTETVDTLLPETDVVGLNRWKDEKPDLAGFVSWKRFTKVMGKGLQKTEHWPARWHVRRFPTASELKALQPTEDPTHVAP